jgi:hypothetical protein
MKELHLRWTGATFGPFLFLGLLIYDLLNFHAEEHLPGSLLVGSQRLVKKRYVVSQTSRPLPTDCIRSRFFLSISIVGADWWVQWVKCFFNACTDFFSVWDGTSVSRNLHRAVSAACRQFCIATEKSHTLGIIVGYSRTLPRPNNGVIAEKSLNIPLWFAAYKSKRMAFLCCYAILHSNREQPYACTYEQRITIGYSRTFLGSYHYSGVVLKIFHSLSKLHVRWLCKNSSSPTPLSNALNSLILTL